MMILPPTIEIVRQPGYVYLVRLRGIYENKYKIGKTRDLKNRLGTICSQNGLKVQLIAYGYSNNMGVAEIKVQNKYRSHCVHGEYFHFNSGQLWDVIRTIGHTCGGFMETDYSIPCCQNDDQIMIYNWNKQRFECEFCGNIISFDNYPICIDKMLPYCYDEMCDDDMRCAYDKYHCIYDTLEDF